MTTEYEACEVATKKYFMECGPNAAHPCESKSSAVERDYVWFITLRDRDGSQIWRAEWVPGSVLLGYEPDCV
jgi:hypothetical protein